ncbi:MAG TPA: outer membrane beta-barrel protein, partial [Longimicrobiaceae bacterium]|nr:outer membrane beta-barrel protein [Longimicrobiaceae bacterium]
FVLGAALAASAHAQTGSRLSVEVRGGAGFPTGSFGAGQTIDTNGACCLHNSTGWNVTGSVLFAVTSNLEVYAGYRHDEFSVDNPAGPASWHPVDDGVAAGMRLGLPVRVGARFRPFAEAGVMLSNARTVSDRDDVLPTDAREGFEVGGGLAVNLARRFSLTPAVRYRKHKTHVRAGMGFQAANGEVAYLSADVGLQFRP